MGILRADLLTHSQLPSANGSVELDGTSDFIQVPASSAWRIGDANLAHKSVTIEWWIYQNSVSGSYSAFNLNHTAGLVAAGSSGLYTIYGGGQTLITESILGAAVANRWYHYALVIHGGPAATLKSIHLYRDGKLSGSGKINSNYGIGDSSNVLCIGDKASGDRSVNGYISNFRWSDEVVYNSEFTVPKFKLKALPSTLLLCCQSSTSATEATVSISGSLTASGNATHSSFGPSLKNDITDTGVVFDGFGSFATSTYMVPPSGKTTERNRGRMILFGGGSPGRTDNIDSLEIQSMGNAVDFGSLSAAVFGGGATASSTRGVFWLGEATYTTLEFVTISNSSNSTTFGTGTSNNGGYGFGNQTRGIWALGTKNILEFVTIATTGNTTDFGDQTLVSGGAITEPVAFASPTRGVIAGGYGNNPYPQSNVIEFVTIATTGNATDFGDAVELKRASYNGSSPTRGVFAAGTPATSASNSIEFITIATTGNASDFGDTRNPQRSGSGCSDSHGGLS